jgi:hypothetical protein
MSNNMEIKPYVISHITETPFQKSHNAVKAVRQHKYTYSCVQLPGAGRASVEILSSIPDTQTLFHFQLFCFLPAFPFIFPLIFIIH